MSFFISTSNFIPVLAFNIWMWLKVAYTMLNCIHFKNYSLSFSISTCCSLVKSCPTLCDPIDCSTPGFPVLHYRSEFAQIHAHESVMLSNHLILCLPLLHLSSVSTSMGTVKFLYLGCGYSQITFWPIGC